MVIGEVGLYLVECVIGFQVGVWYVFFKVVGMGCVGLYVDFFVVECFDQVVEIFDVGKVGCFWCDEYVGEFGIVDGEVDFFFVVFGD